jgi:radical SAM superfamily enzyme YgiQ (UPF0313 family)
MRVLLIAQKINYPHPNPCIDIFGQGFPYIAAALKEKGHEVFGINLNTVWCYGSAPLTLEREIRKAIKRHEPQLVGVGGLTGDYRFVRDAISFTRHIAPHIPILCGGGIITYDPYYIFSHLRPDFGIIGEGEEVVVRLADSIEKKEDINNIPNIAFWQDNRPVYTRIDFSYKQLDELPFPDYDPFDYERFLEMLNQADNNFYAHTRQRPRVIPISMGRSCPFECTFCCHSSGPKYRRRSIDNALNELVYLYKKYKFNFLFIYDELFALRKEKVMEFCSKIKKLKTDFDMDFDWTCDLRVNEADEEMLGEMKKAGCSFIGYGLESANQKVLNSMKKRITVKQMAKAIKMTDETGIGVQGNFILGDPAETEESIKETKEFFDNYCADLMINFNYLTPYPGSEVFQSCLDNDIINNKEQYYNNIGHIGRYKINMTGIPNDIFFPMVDNLVDITGSSLAKMAQLKTAPALHCEEMGEFEPDYGLSFLFRRSLYKIRVKCPICNELIEYLFPLRIDISKNSESLPTYCARCHKRFFIEIPKNACESPKKHPAESIYSFQKICDIVEPTFITYKNYNIFDSEYAGIFYAIPFHIGAVDLTKPEQLKHPDILSAKNRKELERLIDGKDVFGLGATISSIKHTIKGKINRL